MGKRILVVGPGYTGAPLAESLVKAGNEVIAASRSDKEVPGCSSIEMDLADRNSVEALTRNSELFDAIVHCASSSRGGAESYRTVYVDGARNLAAAFPNAPLFFTSSTSVYPQVDGEIVTEVTPADSASETGRLLREAESVVLENGGCVLRLSGIYGPGRSIHLKRILSGKASIESGEPSRYLNQIHREDIVSAIVHLLDGDLESCRGEIFNVSDDVSLTMRECYEWLADRFGKTLGEETEPERNGKRAWTNKQVSNAKLRGLGWQPEYSTFRDAVERDPELVESIREMQKRGKITDVR